MSVSNDNFSVAVGDIYRDTDPRMSDRLVKVTAFDGRFAHVVGCSEWGQEIGRRTRISLAGLRSRFERVGGSTQQEDLERAALAALIEWRAVDRNFDAFRSPAMPVPPGFGAWYELLNALRKATDALSPVAHVPEEVAEVEGNGVGSRLSVRDERLKGGR